MQEQKYIIKNKKDFNVKHIFECGQCFRWNEELDGSYTGVIGNNVVNIVEKEKELIFTSFGEDKLEELVNKYFNLEMDYSKIKNKLAKIDDYLKSSIEYGNGIRILKQNIWECIISFIISANNNIPRIKKIIENLSRTYGNEIEWNNKKYYTFPTTEELSLATVEDLRKLGLGFRDERVYTTTKMILEKQVDIELLEKVQEANIIKEELIKLSGVGGKVADCILLFGFNRFEVFPIDVWVRRVMNELYIKNENEEKVSKQEIEKLAKEKYKNLAGLAQQYLFYWRREA